MSGPRATEMRAVLEKAWKVPGLYRKGEAAFLYRLARRKGNLVELGCWQGRTTVLLLLAARSWQAQVTSVDAFVALSERNMATTAEVWKTNLRKLKLTPPPLLEMTTDEAAQVYGDKPIALLFIDANHSYAGVLRDLENWTPKVQVGGVVALHDNFYPSVTGVCQAVAKWWSKERDADGPRWALVGQRDFTIAFVRRR